MKIKCLLILTTLLLVSFNAYSHQPPYVDFICKFVDRQGNEVSGLLVYLGTTQTWGKGEIEKGEARVRVSFMKSYQGILKMRIVTHSKKKIDLITEEGKTVPELLFDYTHIRQRKNAGEGPLNKVLQFFTEKIAGEDPLNDGVQYFTRDNKIITERKKERLFKLDWDPSMTTEEQKKQKESLDLIDRKNQEEFQRLLEEAKHY